MESVQWYIPVYKKEKELKTLKVLQLTIVGGESLNFVE